MKRASAALSIWLAFASAALAQNFQMPPPAGVNVFGVVVVNTCGALNLTIGQPAYATMDKTGALCNSGSGGGGGGVSVTYGGPIGPVGTPGGYQDASGNFQPFTVGQQVSAASQSVTYASDGTPVPVVGNISSGSTDSGNPVKTGCVYTATKPGPFSANQRSDTQCGTRGSTIIQLAAPDASSAITFIAAGANGKTNGFTAYTSDSRGSDYNGATWDSHVGNVDTAALITLTAAAAGTTNSPDQTNYNGRGAQVGVNITVDTTCSALINIQGKDVASGQYYTILASAALATAAFTNMTVYPGAAVTANVSIPQPLPRTWRVQAVLTGVSCAVTGTVGASVVN